MNEVQVYDGDGRRPYVDVKVTRIPTSVADAVKLLNEIISDEDKDAIKSAAKGKLFMFHHGFGQWIRNNFGLWQDNQALLKDAEPTIVVEPDYIAHVAQYPGYKVQADDVSSLIITKFWESLQ